MEGRWFMIVNPVAGGGRGLLDYPQISRLLYDAVVPYDPQFTEHKFHAVELTVTAINSGYRKIMVLGGDGTLHEVVNGLFIQKLVAPADVTLGVIGVGTGNDWMRTFGYEAGRYKEIVDSICQERTILQDVGVVGYEESKYQQIRYMVGVSSAGLGAQVVKRFSHKQLKRRSWRDNRTQPWHYLYNVVRTFFKYKSSGMRIYIDGELVCDNLLLTTAVGVCKFNGGGIQQLPKAVVDDGLLDMTIIRPLYIWHIIFRLWYLFDGNIYRIGHTEHFRGSHIRIESVPRCSVEVDGELIGDTPVEYTVLERAIKVVVSQNYHCDNQ